jgi:hypothetical protein
MQTLSTDDLMNVTGAKGAATVSECKGNGSGSDAMLATMQSIQSSLKELGKPDQGLFSGANAMMFVVMALAFNRPQPGPVVVYGGPRVIKLRRW